MILVTPLVIMLTLLVILEIPIMIMVTMLLIM